MNETSRCVSAHPVGLEGKICKHSRVIHVFAIASANVCRRVVYVLCIYTIELHNVALFTAVLHAEPY